MNGRTEEEEKEDEEDSSFAAVGQYPIHQSASSVYNFAGMARIDLRFKDAWRVMNAELWLRLGERGEALSELRRLTRRGWRHPWAQRVFVAARTMT